MPADLTTLIIRNNDSTNVFMYPKEISILNASSATITIPTSLQFSNNIPSELSEIGSSGIAETVSRSDHIHPSTGMTLNGGNF